MHINPPSESELKQLKQQELILQWNTASDRRETFQKRRNSFMAFCWNPYREQLATLREMGDGRQEYERASRLLGMTEQATAYVHRNEDYAKVGGVCLLIGAVAWLIAR